jgi:hypothetical protein
MDMNYICTGHVHPERADISFGQIEMMLDTGYRVATSCDASQVTVVLDSAAVDGWITAQIVAADVAGIVVGALGLALGSGYSVEIFQVTELNGTPHVFGVRPSGETPQQTLGFDPHLPIFNRAFRLSVRDVFFRLAVRDYLRAITVVADCATYCYRAIEGLKAAFVFKTGMDRWDEMHATLGTDKETIFSTIKDYADPIRHGNWVNAKPANAQERWAMLSLARTILEKYLNYAEPAT